MCQLCGSKKIRYFLTDSSKNIYWICNDCDFVFQKEIPDIKYGLSNWAGVKDPDGKIRDLTKERDFKLKNWYGGILDRIKALKPGKILDIGCGLGYLLSALPPDWDKYGFDISGFALEFIKSNFPDIKLITNLNLDQAPPPEEQRNIYDVVVCYHVIEHVQDPDFFLKNATMLLKSKGLLIIGTPNMGSLAAKIFKGNFRLLGEGHVSLFNDKNLAGLMEKNNLQIYKKEFPFFKTVYFTPVNLIRMLNPARVSPPFYGSIMTFYARSKQS